MVSAPNLIFKMPTPDIIFLNGTSSSGKTTLCKLLQDQLEQVYLHVPLDAFGAMFPQSKLHDQDLCSSAAPKMFEGFYRCVAALVDCGNKVIVDTVAHENQAHQFQRLFEHLRVVYVAVHCPIAELERREKARGDRTIGLAHSQFLEVHQFLRYDLEVNTFQQTSQQCAEIIKEFLQTEHSCKRR